VTVGDVGEQPPGTRQDAERQLENNMSTHNNPIAALWGLPDEDVKPFGHPAHLADDARATVDNARFMLPHLDSDNPRNVSIARDRLARCREQFALLADVAEAEGIDELATACASWRDGIAATLAA
jgi:hypothetical protein